jgi:thiamine pyrophosphokinase
MCEAALEFKTSPFDNLEEIEELEITDVKFQVSDLVMDFGKISTTDFVSDLGRVIRKWGEERYVPIRQQVDEDWKD